MADIELLNTLFKKYDLGIITKEPTKLTGGAKNSVYKIITNKKSYVVKILNKSVKLKPNFSNRIQEVEELINILEKNNIKILVPLKIEENYCIKIENEWLYVFDFYEGKLLSHNEITEDHCEVIAKELARIHKIDLKKIISSNYTTSSEIDWDYYLSKALEINSVIYDELNSNINLIKECQEKKNNVIKTLPKYNAICHYDLHINNVLWDNLKFKIVDLDLVKYENPCIEFFQVALKWSGYNERNIDLNKLKKFSTAYLDIVNYKNVNWNNIFDYLSGNFGWLEFNLKRALRLGGTESLEEVKLGEQKVIEIIQYMKYNRAIQLDKVVRKSIIDCFN